MELHVDFCHVSAIVVEIKRGLKGEHDFPPFCFFGLCKECITSKEYEMAVR